LEHHGIADFVRNSMRFLEALEIAVPPRDHRHARLDQGVPRLSLGAHQLHRSHRRSNEYQPRIRAGAGKLRVLGEEAVTGEDGLCAASLGGVKKAVDSKITFGGGSRPDVKSLVGIADMQRFAVHVGIDRHRANSHLTAGAHHAHRNLATVGYQNLAKHCAFIAALPAALACNFLSAGKESRDVILSGAQRSEESAFSCVHVGLYNHSQTSYRHAKISP